MHMFHSMGSRYQTHGAQLLRVVVRSLEVQEQKPWTILQLSFADENNPSRALSAPIQSSDEKAERTICGGMIGKV